MRISVISLAASALALVPAVAHAQLAYNSTPTATYFFGTQTNYSPANSAVLTAGGDQLFARFHERVTGPGGSSDFAPVSNGSVYNFALGTPGISFDYGITSAGGLAGLTGSITVTNLTTGLGTTFSPFLPDNAIQGNTTENSENFAFGFLAPVGYNPNVNNTYRFTMNVNGLQSGSQSLTIDAQVGTGAVPEVATWAMMVGGFGMVGGALRRRRTTVRFA